MKAPIFFAVLVALFGCSSAAHAFPYTAYGIGAKSCGAWIEARARRGEFARDDEYALTSWSLGYLSAVGNYGPKLRHTDSDGVKVYLDHYCAAHPVANFSDALDAMVKELTQ